jgi:hypothetical protein
MADSLLGLGSALMFPRNFNWLSPPSGNLEFARSVLMQPGTVHEMVTISADAPITVSGEYMTWTKADEYALLAFFHARRGRVQRFWVKYPGRAFTLQSAATTGATVLNCEVNRAYMQYQGYERIYVVMSTGDILTRQVTAVVHNEALGRIELALGNPIDRDITLTNHLMIGRLLLVRFDADDMSVRLVSDRVTEFRFSFKELVQEYAVA